MRPYVAHPRALSDPIAPAAAAHRTATEAGAGENTGRNTFGSKRPAAATPPQVGHGPPRLRGSPPARALLVAGALYPPTGDTAAGRFFGEGAPPSSAGAGGEGVRSLPA